MKFIIWIALLIVYSTSTLANCGSANYKTQILKRKLIASVHRINADYGSEPDLLLKQFEALTKDLSAARELAEISESTLKYCMGKGFTREIYSLKNKNTIWMTIFGYQGSKLFQEQYIVPNSTWTEAANALERDIIAKRESIKLKLISSFADKKVKEQQKKAKLRAELKELQEMKALVSGAHKVENENKKLAQSVKNEKNEIKNLKLQQQHRKSNKQVHKNDNIYVTVSNNTPMYSASEESKLTEKMAIYATILGRATACGMDVSIESKKVGTWMDRVFPPGTAEQQRNLPIFVMGLKYHMNQQLKGKSLDSCPQVRRVYNSFLWP